MGIFTTRDVKINMRGQKHLSREIIFNLCPNVWQIDHFERISMSFETDTYLTSLVLDEAYHPIINNNINKLICHIHCTVLHIKLINLHLKLWAEVQDKCVD